MNFIRRGSDGRLYDGNQVFRFASYNVPGLFLLQDRPICRSTLWGFRVCSNRVPGGGATDSNGYSYGNEYGQSCIVDPVPCVHTDTWVIPTTWEQEEAIASIAMMSGRVIRGYTLAVGSAYHITGIRTYYEPAFVALDNAIALARKYGVRLIIPLINNHWGGDSNTFYPYGDYGAFAALRGLPPSSFYTNANLQADFKHFITFLLNRVNTVTRVRYADDPTIFAYELGNELGGWTDPGPPASWTLGMAALLKSIAPKTLVMDGMMGGLNAPTRLVPQVLQSSLVDIFGCHYYWGSSDIARVPRDTAFVTNYGKAFIAGEFGLSDVNTYNGLFSAVYNSKAAGILIWSLRYRSRDGGFYVHSEGNNYYAYHIPGFPYGNSFASDEQRVIQLIWQYAMMFAGKSVNTPYPTPRSPQGILGITPKMLRWRGGSWTAKYTLYRSSCSKFSSSCTGPTQWTWVASGVFDNVISGNMIWKETANLQNQLIWYQIVPIGLSNNPGTAVIVGPYTM